LLRERARVEDHLRGESSEFDSILGYVDTVAE
jgi:hypothetical protein